MNAVAQQKLEKLFSFFLTRNQEQERDRLAFENSDAQIIKNPFHELCDPELFYAGSQHARIFESLRQCCLAGLSLGSVTGEVGSGKSMLCQMLRCHLDPGRITQSYVLGLSRMSPAAFLKAVLHGLGYRIQIIEKRYAASDLFHLLGEYCRQLQASEQRLVILIDEAHLLSAEALKVVKSISCLENPQDKWASCLLFGEPNLNERLEHEVFASLKSRFYVREQIDPLSMEETRAYITHRLHAAGYPSNTLMESELQMIAEESCGNCRDINKLAYERFRLRYAPH